MTTPCRVCSQPSAEHADGIDCCGQAAPAPSKHSEWTEIREALAREYGHPYTYRGMHLRDFSRHPYVGRAGALLLMAERWVTVAHAIGYASVDDALKATPSAQPLRCDGCGKTIAEHDKLLQCRPTAPEGRTR